MFNKTADPRFCCCFLQVPVRMSQRRQFTGGWVLSQNPAHVCGITTEKLFVKLKR
jgi:hypothetical protein